MCLDNGGQIEPAPLAQYWTGAHETLEDIRSHPYQTYGASLPSLGLYWLYDMNILLVLWWGEDYRGIPKLNKQLMTQGSRYGYRRVRVIVSYT